MKPIIIILQLFINANAVLIYILIMRLRKLIAITDNKISKRKGKQEDLYPVTLASYRMNYIYRTNFRKIIILKSPKQ